MLNLPATRGQSDLFPRDSRQYSCRAPWSEDRLHEWLHVLLVVGDLASHEPTVDGPERVVGHLEPPRRCRWPDAERDVPVHLAADVRDGLLRRELPLLRAHGSDDHVEVVVGRGDVLTDVLEMQVPGHLVEAHLSGCPHVRVGVGLQQEGGVDPRFLLAKEREHRVAHLPEIVFRVKAVTHVVPSASERGTQHMAVPHLHTVLAIEDRGTEAEVRAGALLSGPLVVEVPRLVCVDEDVPTDHACSLPPGSWDSSPVSSLSAWSGTPRRAACGPASSSATRASMSRS